MDCKKASAIAFTWRIERRDGAGIALTSHDGALLRGRVEYRPDPGVMPSAITRKLGLEPNSGEVAGALSAAALTETDLRLGRWDGARVALDAVDWQDDAADSQGLLHGELGAVSISGESFSAELNGAAINLGEPICPSTSPECRADFGGRQCRVDLAGRTVRANVVGSEGTTLEVDRDLDERFLFGRMRYMSGRNCGAVTVILGVSGREVRVRDLPKADVADGCILELREGCDKRFDTCVTRFGNAPNFRGEPHLPGNDLLTRYPGA